MNAIAMRGTGIARHDGGGAGGHVSGHAGGHLGGHGHHGPGRLAGGDDGGDGGGGSRGPWVRILALIAFVVVVALLAHFA